MLTKLNGKVDVATNGQEALELAKTGAYHVVFMDCNMPIMDGYTATQKIREFDSDLTIFALTADAMPEPAIGVLKQV